MCRWFRRKVSQQLACKRLQPYYVYLFQVLYIFQMLLLTRSPLARIRKIDLSLSLLISQQWTSRRTFWFCFYLKSGLFCFARLFHNLNVTYLASHICRQFVQHGNIFSVTVIILEKNLIFTWLKLSHIFTRNILVLHISVFYLLYHIYSEKQIMLRMPLFVLKSFLFLEVF